MRIVLDIERLILHGLPLTAVEANRIRSAMAAELSRLLGAGPIPARFFAGAAVASLVAPPLGPAAGRTPEALGTDLAHAVHAGLIGPQFGNRDRAIAGKQGERRT